MKDKRKVIIPIAAVIVLGLVLYAVYKPKDFKYVGTIEATRVDISARVSSVIANISATEGKKIEKGEILLQMACEDIKIAADSAARDYDRALKLLKTGAMAQEVYDHLKTKRDDTALKREWCLVSSPIGGTVLTSYREQGELVNPGMKLFTLADLSNVWVMVYVPGGLLPELKLRQKVKGFLYDIDDRSFSGEIIKISDVAEFTPKNVQTSEERTRLVFGVKVSFANLDGMLKPGMSIEVDLGEQK